MKTLRLRTLFLAVAAAGLLAVFLWQTQWSWSSFDIKDSDVTEATEHAIASKRFPSGLTIRIAGHIDGHAHFETHDGILTAIGPGPVNETISADYYSHAATIQYRPQKVTKGQLLVAYKFHYL